MTLVSRNLISILLSSLIAFFMLSETMARTIYIDQRVDPETAKHWTGASAVPKDGDGPLPYHPPVLKTAQPGDIISFVPGSGPYGVPLRCLSNGEPDNPIIIEGNSVTIDLRIPLNNRRWSRGDDGAWIMKPEKSDRRLKIEKYRKVKNGEIVPMTVAFYKNRPIGYHVDPDTPPPPFSAVLLEDNRLAFYLPEEMQPPFKGLSLFRRPGISAVSFEGASHWIIRNLNVIGAGNDGFNYHHYQKSPGEARGIVIENCSAMFCGDEGASAHEDYQVDYRDCLFAFNASTGGGVSDMMETRTTYENCISVYNCGAGFYLRSGVHSVVDCLSAGNMRLENSKSQPPEIPWDLPPDMHVEKLVQAPRDASALEKIKTWKPEHPQMPLLLKTIKDLQKKGADLTF